ncbi:hypothetical protein ACJQWK_03646 [Exserohilum turcicum]
MKALDNGMHNDSSPDAQEATDGHWQNTSPSRLSTKSITSVFSSSQSDVLQKKNDDIGKGLTHTLMLHKNESRAPVSLSLTHSFGTPNQFIEKKNSVFSDYQRSKTFTRETTKTKMLPHAVYAPPPWIPPMLLKISGL